MIDSPRWHAVREPLNVRVMRLAHAQGLDLPTYATAGAAGMDLRAAVDDDAELAAGDRMSVPTGLVFEIPQNFEAQVRPRSGLALRHGITCLNAPGTIDAYYRGEVMVILANLGRETFTLKRGMRIAQLVFAPVLQVRLEMGDRLGGSERGATGFGSTGLS